MVKDANGVPVTTHRGGSIRKVDQEQLQKMLIFIAGGVRTWCKAIGEEQFALRDLFGGDNYCWEGTPLQVLYDKYCTDGCSHDEAVRLAGNSAGRLLKRVLIEDTTRTYVIGDAGKANGYKWEK